MTMCPWSQMEEFLGTPEAAGIRVTRAQRLGDTASLSGPSPRVIVHNVPIVLDHVRWSTTITNRKNLEIENLAQDPFLVTNCRKEILLKFDQKVYLKTKTILSNKLFAQENKRTVDLSGDQFFNLNYLKCHNAAIFIQRDTNT